MCGPRLFACLPLRLFLLSLWRDLEQRRRSIHNRRLCELDLFHVFARREVEHHFRQLLFENRAEAARARAALERLRRNRAKCRVLEGELHFLELDQLGVLLGQRVLRLLEDADERLFVQRLEGHRDRQTADELGDQPQAEQIVRHDLGERVLRLDRRAPRRYVLIEADLTTAGTSLEELLEAVKGAAADEEDVLRVDLDVFLLRVLAATLRRTGRDRTLEDLQQSLLNTFAGDVAGNARVLRLAGDFVDFVDVDDTALALGDVEVTGLKQTHENVLDVFTDVARFGQRA